MLAAVSLGLATHLVLPLSLSDLFVDIAAQCAAADGSAIAPYCSIGEAVAASNPGDVIHIAPGVYPEQVDLPHDLTLFGTEGPDATTIDAMGGAGVIHISVGSSAHIEGLTITGSVATPLHAPIWSRGPLCVVNSTISHNYTGTASNCGVFHRGGPLEIRRCLFSDNEDFVLRAGTGGDPMLVEDTEFRDNSGRLILVVNMDVTIRNTTIHDNTSMFASSIEAIYCGRFELVNSTITDNLSAAVAVSYSQSPTIENCTIANNISLSTQFPARTVSGITVGPGPAPSVRNSIIAGNLLDGAPADFWGSPVVSLGNNLVGAEDLAGSFVNGVAGDLVGTAAQPLDPVLLPLTDNGGRAPTRALGATSPAINAGSTSGFPLLDQRGLVRPMGASDIGAVRFSFGTLPPLCTANPNSTGARGDLFAIGSDDPSDTNFTLVATSLPVQSLTMAIASMTEGVTARPGGSDGVLCLAGSIGRFLGPGQLAQSSVLGIAAVFVDLNSIPQVGGSVPVLPGTTWSFQAWHRDTGPMGPTSNFTTALRVAF